MTAPDPAAAAPSPGTTGTQAGGSKLTSRRDATVEAVYGGARRLVRVVRTPLLAAAFSAGVPSLVLIASALPLGWPVNLLPLVVGAVGALVAGWALVRRKQLLAAVADPHQAAADIGRALSVTDLIARLGEQPATPAKSSRRAISRARGLWRGIQVGHDAWESLAELPSVAPFLPGRLRGLGWLLASCAVFAIVACVLTAITLVSLLVS